MASIRLRETKKSGPRYYLIWRDSEGKQRSRALKTSDERLAKIHLRAFERERGKGAVRGGSGAASPRAALGEFLGERALLVSPATVSIDRDRLGSLLRAWENVPPPDWTRARLIDYVAGHDWAPRTTQIFLRRCKAFIDWCHEQDIPIPDFVAGFKGPSVRTRPFAPLTPKAAAGLFHVSRGHYLELPIALGILAGFSREDIRQLTWDEVDLDTGIIQRLRSKTAEPIHVHISPTLREILGRHRRLTGRVCRGLPAKESMSRALKRLFKTADVNKGRGTWHRLRHTFGDTLQQEGVGLATIGRLMSHKPGSVVTLRYLHTDEERLRDAVDAVDRRIRQEAG